VAFVLVIFTAFLWKSTEKYAKLTEKDLKEKERTRQIERLNKEMDDIIGQLYSRLEDRIYFNIESFDFDVIGDTPHDKAQYNSSEFWRNIKRNLYLTTPGTRKAIKSYLEIKIGIKDYGEDETNQSYQKDLKNIIYVVEERYKEITKNLEKLEEIRTKLSSETEEYKIRRLEHIEDWDQQEREEWEKKERQEREDVQGS
jgi:hypothetical protein